MGSQPLPTRAKRIESAVVGRSAGFGIRTDVQSVVGREWTAGAVRGPRRGKRGAFLLTRAAQSQGGLCGQALGMLSSRR